MAGILDARKKVVDFFTGELKRDEGAVRIMEVSKSDGGWTGAVEVTEDNLFMKKMGYPPVYDKNLYKVKLNTKLDVVSYKQVDSLEEEGEEE